MIKVLLLIFTISLSMSSWAQDTVTEIPLSQDEIDAILNNGVSSPTTNNDSNSTISDSSQASTEVPNTGSDNTDEMTASENEDEADETSESGNTVTNTTATAISVVSQAATARSLYNEYQIKQRIGNSIEGLLERRGFNRAKGRSNSWTNKNLELLKGAQKKRSFSRKFKGLGVAGIAIGTLGYLYLNFDIEDSSEEIPNCNYIENTNQTELIDADTLDLINNLEID